MAEAASGAAISRRRMLGLGMSGAVAAGLTVPHLRALGGALGGALEIVEGRNRVALVMGGVERFVIDGARFVGRPRVLVERTGGTCTLALLNARWPGTDLPADLTLTVRPGLLNRTATIETALGMKATVRLEPWLQGRERAVAPARLENALCALGNGERVQLRGEAELCFAPDWTLAVEGDGIAHCEMLGASLSSSLVHLRLPAVDETSLIVPVVSRRTLIHLDRGGRQWPIVPESLSGGLMSFVAEGSPFDLLTVEAAESMAGNRRHAAVAESLNGRSALAVVPSRTLHGSDGQPAALPLRNARLAVAFDPGGDTVAVSARFADPVWLHADGTSLLVGDEGDTSRFELVARAGIAQSLTATPSLLATLARLADAGRTIVEPARPAPGSLIAMRLGSIASPVSGGLILADLVFDPDRPVDPPTVTVSAPVRIVRPEDLLVLDVMFHNMSVQSVGGVRKISRTGSPAYLILQFQPQAINEQAFFETESSSTSEDPTPPPVASRIAEASRLAFSVPASQGPFDFTIENILDLVRRWNMNLIPTGQEPPKAEPSSNGLLIDGVFEIPMITADDIKVGAQTNTAIGAALKGAVARRSSTTLKGPMVRTTERVDPRVRVDPRIKVDATRDVAGATETAFARFETTRFRRSSIYRKSAREFRIVDQYRGNIFTIKPELRPPSAAETIIEAPFRMLLSPNTTGAWAHSSKPVVSPRTGRAELWHTRLGVRGSDGIRDDGNAPTEVKEGETITTSTMGAVTQNDFVFEGESNLRAVRAVWARDEHFLQYETTPGSGTWFEETKAEYADSGFKSRPKHFPSNPDDWAFRASLDATDRFDIVQLSANYWIRDYTPKPIRVDRLMLSALGAWMNVRGAWTIPAAPCVGKDNGTIPTVEGDYLSVEEWRHRMAMGRDTYVRVVYKGYLFPFGHQASLIKVTERKFHRNKPGNPAYLRQRMYIVVREPERTYLGTGLTIPSGNGLPNRQLDLEMPLMRVKLQTLVTPNIDPPEASDISSLSQSLFWVRVADADFLWHIEAEDFDGHTFSFTAPLIFMENSKKHDASAVGAAITKYNTGTWDGDGSTAAQRKARPTRRLEGASLTIAPSSSKSGDTTFEATEATFSAEQLTMVQLNTLGKCDSPLFYPVVRAMRLVIPAMRGISGNKEPGRFTWHNSYLEHGFAAGAGQNKGEMLLANDPVEAKLKMSFQTAGDKAGALVKPNMALAGLSRKMGPVSGNTDTLATGAFKPKEFFPAGGPDIDDMLPLIFGCIPLGAILQAVEDLGSAVGLDQVPKFINEIGNKLEEFISRITALVEQGKKYADTAVNTAKGAVEIGQAASALVSEAGSFSGKVSAAQLKIGTDPYEAKNDLVNAINGLKGKVDGVKLALNEYDGFTAPAIQSARSAAIGALTTLANGLGQAVQSVNAASAQASAIASSVQNGVAQAQALLSQVSSLGGQLSSFTSISPASAASTLLDMIGLTPIMNAMKLVVGDIVGPGTAASTLGAIINDNDPNHYRTGGTNPDKNEDGLVGFFNSLAGAVSDPTAAATQISEKLNDFKADLGSLRSALQGYSGPSFPDLDSARAQVVAFIQDVENAIGVILDGLDLFIRILEAITQQKIHFEWRPALQSFSFESSPSGDDDYIFLAKDNGKAASFAIIVEFGMKSEESGSPYFKVDCALRDFTVNLIAPFTCIALHFDRIQFLADQGLSPDVNVILRDIEFVGPLSFIETLKDLIPLDGFSDPPAIDVSEKGITASFGMALPNVAVGVFSLTNVSINAGFTIPFIGEPLSVTFSLCTRDNPFSLTVYIFGGGGFFGITLNPSGIHLLEVAFEFGLQGAIDFGVCGASVKVVAGIYFKLTMDTDPTSCTVTGYLKLQGKAYVLFITASITLYLEISYESVSGKMTGRAELTIEVDLPFVPDIHITYEKKFAGSNGDPSFKEMYEPYTLSTGETVKPWNSYCVAFCDE